MQNTFRVNGALVDALIAKVATLKGARFAGFTYTNAKGENSRYVFNIGVDYRNALLRSKEIIEERMKSAKGIDLEACEKAIASINNSIAHHDAGVKNPDYTCKDTFTRICDNMKIHVNTGEVYISGLEVSKKILSGKAIEKPLTENAAAMERALEGTPKSKWRQLKVNPDNLASIRIEGTEIET